MARTASGSGQISEWKAQAGRGGARACGTWRRRIGARKETRMATVAIATQTAQANARRSGPGAGVVPPQKGQ
jgi:hypothetical protein